MPVVERGDHAIPIFDRYSPTGVQRGPFEAVSTSAVLEWTPTPELGRVLAPGETVRVLTVEQWRALRQLPEHLEYVMTRACWCESHLNPSERVMDTNGHWSIGACMVQPVWWGDVSADLEGQIAQVARILDSQRNDPRGPTWPWAATKDGCAGWNAK